MPQRFGTAGHPTAYTPEEINAELVVGVGANELIGNNRALVARRFDPAVTTVLGIAVTMIAPIWAS